MLLSTAHLSAKDVMNSVAALMNDPEMTDYTYVTMLPYLNLAIEELNEHLEEANVAPSNQVSQILKINIGENQLYNPPIDIVEIQEIGERQFGADGIFIPLPRKEFPDAYPTSSSLLFWCWKNQRVYFNPNGANNIREVQLKYIARPVRLALDEHGLIGNSNASMYLTYKTGALCSQFIGENQSRAAILNEEAEQALERIISISNKGRQQIMTRHRPFRAGYKTRSW